MLGNEVPSYIVQPDYSQISDTTKSKLYIIDIKDEEEIAKMRLAGKLAREVLDIAVRAAKPGVSTNDINNIVHIATIERNSYPSPLNYQGFPKSCCTSVNDVMCHGIPDSTLLKDGDIVNIDVTIFHDGVHGDCSETVLIGNVDDKTKKLVRTAYDALQAGISVCRPGVKYSAIGCAIDSVISKTEYSIPREFVGHGIGKIFHASPHILHFRNNMNMGIMHPGHTFTIEPIVNMGSAEYITWSDNWTTSSVDKKPSAQFEVTITYCNHALYFCLYICIFYSTLF
jgi:methionyl aminopeptidase